jgi:uncharacterized membrane protein YbhN (UPF0104 family)
VKALLAVLIVGGVGWQFAKLLREPVLWDRPWEFDAGWLAASAVLYVLGLGCWGGFWIRLLAHLGERPPVLPMLRAYYVSHLGKYVPGKAWAILLRVTLGGAAGVRPGVLALTATYETLTTMAAGALLAAALLPFVAVGSSGLGWHALGLLALAGVPILPGVFARLTRRVAKPFLDPDAPPLPTPRLPALVEGLALTAVGWCFLGVSLWALLRAVAPGVPAASPEVWLRCTADNALSYVAGFLALPAPGGLGVREAILQQMLTGELQATEGAAAWAALAALLVRLLWTVTDVAMAAAVYWLPGRPRGL